MTSEYPLTPPDDGAAPWRRALRRFLDHRTVQQGIIALIIVNAVILGLETSASVMAAVGGLLVTLDRAILAIFVVELALRILAWGWRFFRDPWGIFDLAVVGIALLPATGPLSVLRALRILRVLRLVSAIPRMRNVVQGLVGAIPGIASIIALLGLVLFVSSVAVTKLLGAAYPDWFGTMGASLFTLFQIMTLEGWADIVREIGATHPWAWLFFVPFILIATFTILNLFIAVVVGAMQAEHDAAAEMAAAEVRAETRKAEEAAVVDRRSLQEEVRALRQEIAELRADLSRRQDQTTA